MSSMSPVISVVMPVYNAGKYLREAIDSVLNQTFSDFEFLIYNDGSIDDSDEIIKSYSDPRIIYTRIEKNAGYVTLLNKGIDQAKGQFIARMDADDISLPSRFAEQIKFMNENLEIGICGCWIEQFGSRSGQVKLPSSNIDIITSLFYGTPFAHPSVIIRKSVLKENKLYYNNDYLFAEDYELFERMLLITKAANINKFLLKYRLHSTQVSTRKWNQQYFLAGKIQARRFTRVLKNPQLTDVKFLEDYFTNNSNINESWFELIEYYKNKILIDNCSYPKEVIIKAVEVFSEKNKVNNIKKYLFRNYYNNPSYSIKLLIKFLNEEKRVRKHIDNILLYKFICKCIFFYKKK